MHDMARRRLTGFILHELSQSGFSPEPAWACTHRACTYKPKCARQDKPHKLLVPPTRPRPISAGWGRSRVAPGCGETGQGGGVVSETPILAAAAGTPCVPLFGGPFDGDTCWSGSDMGGADEMRERSPIMPARVPPARTGRREPGPDPAEACLPQSTCGYTVV